jgi:hypothetical protein
MIAAAPHSTNAPRPVRRNRRPLLALLAAPAVAVVVASFLPWTQRASRPAGAPIGLLEVIVLAVVGAAAIQAYLRHPVFQIASFAMLTYAWACTFTALGLSSRQAARDAARRVEAVGDDLVLRSGFYIAAAALVIATIGWVFVALKRRAEHNPPRLAAAAILAATPSLW